jgi:polyisoprenoid-binding protein YceI
MTPDAWQYLPAVSAAVPVLLAGYRPMRGTHAMTVQIPPAGDYRIDRKNSTIGFATRHMFGLAPVHGTFALRDGHIHVAGLALESSVRATIAAASVTTRNARRDRAVRSPTYLNVDLNPDITFASTRLEEDDGRWLLRGSLTVLDTTKSSDLRIESSEVTSGHLRLVATTAVDRYEFGVTKMKGLIGRRLFLRLNVFAHLI